MLLFDELFWNVSYFVSGAGISLYLLVVLNTLVVDFGLLFAFAVLYGVYCRGSVTAFNRAVSGIEIPGVSKRAGLGFGSGVLLVDVLAAFIFFYGFLVNIGFFAGGVFGGVLFANLVFAMSASLLYWVHGMVLVVRYRATDFVSVFVHNSAVLTPLALALIPVELVSIASRAFSVGLRIFANNVAAQIIEMLFEELIKAVVLEGVRLSFSGLFVFAVKFAVGGAVLVAQNYTIGVLELLTMLIQPCVMAAMAADSFKQARRVLEYEPVAAEGALGDGGAGGPYEK